MSPHTHSKVAPFHADCIDEAPPTSAVRPSAWRIRLAIARARFNETFRPTEKTAEAARVEPEKPVQASPPRAARSSAFDKTKWKEVLLAGAGSPEALDALCKAYYKPLRAFARRLVSDPARADDLLQGFF